MFRIRDKTRPAYQIQEAFEAVAANAPRDFTQEIVTVWRATNDERAKLGKGPIALVEVERANLCAMGHVDYSMKLALYCERLVLDRGEPHE